MEPPAAQRLVFVDTETSGLDPAVDRIIEIGVVAVDAGNVEEWATLLNPRTDGALSSRLLREIGADRARSLPRFSDVAGTLLELLQHRRFVAHNARFDYRFLQAEFDRLGMHFEAEVVCSLMLSRRLYEKHGRHDLATLVERHGLEPEIRHRALPDARAVFRLWQAFRRDHSADRIELAIRELLAEPVLPPALDPALVDRLPERHGVYVLHGNGKALHVGRAGNLRRHLRNWFRVDRISRKSLLLSNSIDDITWKTTAGELGARLQCAVVSRAVLPVKSRRGTGSFSWSFDPAARPALSLVPPSGTADERTFGIFGSERKARNALARLAHGHGLCRALLGIPAEGDSCDACSRGRHPRDRLAHLTQAYRALLPWKIEAWPWRGPVAIRERADLHVLERWRYLGTAGSMEEAVPLLETGLPDFDAEIYFILASALPRVPRRRILRLERASAPEMGRRVVEA
jgi:DNA polymerase-3 subunit epsilon